MTIEELLDWKVPDPLSGPGIMAVRRLDSDGLLRASRVLGRRGQSAHAKLLEKIARGMKRSRIYRVEGLPIKDVLSYLKVTRAA